MSNNSSWINYLSSLSPEKRDEFVRSLSEEEAEAFANQWCFKARPEQLEPGGDWRVWLCIAGRGWGKTRTGSEWIIEKALLNPGCRIALVARTAADARDVMTEGDSGIMACSPKNSRPLYEPSKRRITWPNGSQATTYSADRPEQLRGPQNHFAWADELAAWARLEAWDQLSFGLRLGDSPRVIVTTTPRPLSMLRKLASRSTTFVTKGRTMDNAANLSSDFIELIHDRYEGTTLGRQELDGELLSELPGALFKRSDLDTYRVDKNPELRRIVVAVDPATTSKQSSDESGIVVAGICEKSHLYVLEDCSMRGTPDAVCRRAIDAYMRYRADRLVFESNQGGETWRSIIEQIDRRVPVTLIHASKGKHARAEPIASRLEQGKLHLCGIFPSLEDQLTNYVPGFAKSSPDRLDAMVWACSELDQRTVPEINFNPRDGSRANQWI